MKRSSKYQGAPDLCGVFVITSECVFMSVCIQSVLLSCQMVLRKNTHLFQKDLSSFCSWRSSSRVPGRAGSSPVLRLSDLQASELVVKAVVFGAFSDHGLIFLWQPDSDLFTFAPVGMVLVTFGKTVLDLPTVQIYVESLFSPFLFS